MHQKQYLSKPNLEAVRSQFDTWRDSKKTKTEKIPTELWQAAEQLLGHYKFTHITKTLRLKSNDFKKHIKHNSIESKSVIKSNKTPIPIPMSEFVELKPFNSQIHNYECTIEMQDKDGSKMRINTNGISSINIVHLTQTFWSNKK